MPPVDLVRRRRIGLLIRIGLVFVTFGIVVAWIGGRVSDSTRGLRESNVTVEREAPPASALGPGDIQIFSTDGNVDVILQGDKLMVGLSPQAVAKAKAEMAKNAGNESGLGAVIANAVKSGVASALGTHIAYPLSETKEIRYENNQLVLVTQKGDVHRMEGSVKTDDRSREKKGVEFSREDAERFIAAVNARKRELGIP